MQTLDSILSLNRRLNRKNQLYYKDISQDIQQHQLRQLGLAVSYSIDSLQQQSFRSYRSDTVLRELQEIPKSL
jgi:hypothetical protein